LASFVTIQSIVDRVQWVIDTQLDTDLANVRTLYGFGLNELPVPTVYQYETTAPKSWPYCMALFDRDVVQEWGRANIATETAEIRVVFGVRGNEIKTVRDKVIAYLDAAKRTITRATRDGQAIIDGRYVSAQLGTTFTDGSSLVQFGTLNIIVTYYTTTETT
jgi:hypothetical protein